MSKGLFAIILPNHHHIALSSVLDYQCFPIPFDWGNTNSALHVLAVWNTVDYPAVVDQSNYSILLSVWNSS